MFLSMSNNLAESAHLFYESPDLASEATELARRFNFQSEGLLESSLLKQYTSRPLLYLTHQGLMLCPHNMKPWKIDFLSSEKQHRRYHGGRETLVRACGIKKNKEPQTIIDASAGCGQDAFVLACTGAHVILIERNPVIAALLEDALKRFHAHSALSENIHLTLYFDDAINFLQHRLSILLPDLPDVIYWDPMHPTRQKSAQVKKEMVMLQQWISPESNPESLINLSLPYVKDRVVLKWPQKAPPLKNLKPSFVYKENTVRFEVFKRF